MTPEAIAARDGLTDRFRSFRDYAAGQYTDDTQLALAITRAINRTGRVDGQSIAEEFAELFRTGEIVGAGPVARRAVNRFIEGVAWNEARSSTTCRSTVRRCGSCRLACGTWTIPTG